MEGDQLRELLDKDAIRDCLFRYCRGIDRANESDLRSAYWPDGTDDHGPYKGSAEGFVDWAMATLPHVKNSVHQVNNILIELDGVDAKVETYFSAYQQQPNTEGVFVDLDMKGRYLDQFQKRGDEWRILHRVVVFDRVKSTPIDRED